MTRARFALVLVAFSIVAALALWEWLYWWRRQAEPPVAELVPTPDLPWFVDVTSRSGIDFTHFDSATPTHHIHETMGSGLAWIDFDGDGWPDLFCVQGGPLFPERHPGPPPASRLYRNNGDGTFTDVTQAVGLPTIGDGFAMGCAVGDFDNDGYDDLVVTYLGKIVLYHNESGGPLGRRLVNVTEKAGLRDPYWATSCAWGDIDGDGLLDLYVCNYVQADLARYPPCIHKESGRPLLCAPFVFQPAPRHNLFHNNGDGTFTDVSVSSGIASAALPGPGLGVVMVDIDGDGLIDIYAANDMTPAYLFHNQGKGKYVEKAQLAGCGFDFAGHFIAGMGVAVADVDGSGRPSLLITNFQAKPNILFLNRGNLLFQDLSFRSGLGDPSVNRLGFGTVAFDADLDGSVDFAVVNGHVNRHSQETFGFPYRQEAQLFLGDGRGRFRETSERAGPYFRESHVGRALAWADYDNDGKPDLVVGQLGERIALLRNETPTTNRWLRLELIGAAGKSNRNSIGARIEIEAGGRRQVHFVVGGGSYLSASHRRPLIGLGAAEAAEIVRVRWPSGTTQEFGPLGAGQTWRLLEGEPRARQVEYHRGGKAPTTR